MTTWEIREGDVLDRLREMPDESVIGDAPALEPVSRVPRYTSFTFISSREWHERQRLIRFSYAAMARRRILADHGAVEPTNGSTPAEGVQGRLAF